jgi:hypothetical protein
MIPFRSSRTIDNIYITQFLLHLNIICSSDNKSSMNGLNLIDEFLVIAIKVFFFISFLVLSHFPLPCLCLKQSNRRSSRLKLLSTKIECGHRQKSCAKIFLYVFNNYLIISLRFLYIVFLLFQ